jgi:uncharacterized protein (DUF305 family)
MSVNTKFNLSKANAVTCDTSLLRKALISLAMIFSISALPVARAQDQTTTHRVGAVMASSDEQEFGLDSALALGKMSLEMSVDPTGDVDRDFVAMMIPHAQGAIDVARAELKYGHSEDLRRLARSLIAERESEISDMCSGIGNPSREQQ